MPRGRVDRPPLAGTTIEFYDFSTCTPRPPWPCSPPCFTGQPRHRQLPASDGHASPRRLRPTHRLRDLRALRGPDRPQGHPDRRPADHGHRPDVPDSAHCPRIHQIGIVTS
ncbi:hypothetical protein QJS66_07740 [Kocuria rhizophila]|nr:hypothetical protein QJS66_07740 [Kocuria rhizophila]